MGRRSEIRGAEQRVRASAAYHDWTARNLGPACLNCDSTEELQVHHVVELYHVLLGLWRLYGDVESVVTHAIAMHMDDLCEGITLCKPCHEKAHPGKRLARVGKDVRVEDWTAMPRHLPGPFSHAPGGPPGLTLTGAQVLAAVGWHVLGGRMDSRMVEFRHSQLRRLLGKKKGSSFHRSLSRALDDLKALGVLAGHHESGPCVELHVAPAYLKCLIELPWFMSMGDVRAPRLPVFALRWFLNLQSGRRNYKIGPGKLAAHLGLRTTTPAFVERSVRKACEGVPWATVDFDGAHFAFRLKRRGAVPIWTLRTLVRDAIREGS